MKKIINSMYKQYLKFPVQTRASLWFAICGIFQKGLTLLVTPIFTRLMSAAEYGTYTIYQSWYSILQIFATLNLSSGVLNVGLTKFSDDKNRFMISVQSLSSFVTCVLFFIYLGAFQYWNKILELPAYLLIIMFVQFLVEPAFLFWSVEQRYDYKYQKLIWITILMSVSSVIIGIIAVITFRSKGDARIIVFAAVQIIVGAFFYVYNIKKGKKIIDMTYWKYALSYNLPMIPHFLSSSILNQSDRIMIEKLVGIEQSAKYSIAYSISMMMMIVVNAVNNSYVPYTYQSMKKEEYFQLKKTSKVILVLVGSMCVLAIALGPEILKVFAAKEYYQAVWIIPPVALSVYFVFAYTLYSNIECYYEKTKYIMFVSCISAGLNILLNYLCIPHFGYLAAGYTTLLCYIVFMLGHWLVSRHICRKNIGFEIYNSRFVFFLSIALIFVMLGMTMLYKHTIIRYIIIVSGLMIVMFFRKKIMNVIDFIKK